MEQMVGLLLLKPTDEKQRLWGKLHCRRQGEALAHHLGLQTLNRLHLHGLDYGRIPSYSLVAAKMVERRLATWRRLRHTATVTAVASGGAPAPRMALAAVEGGMGFSSKRWMGAGSFDAMAQQRW
jgi:hypothetical protein